MPSRALYYALDADPRCLYQLRRSVASVRRFAPEIQIYVVIAGAVPPDDRAFLERHDVAFMSSGGLERGTSPTFMKWRALAQGFPEDEVLYVDTDTLVFEDPTRLFELAGPEDFHARLELACEANAAAYPYLINVRLIRGSQIDHGLFGLLGNRLGARVLPVFNTGVMLFRNGLAGRLTERWPDFLRLQRLFSSKLLPYPCSNAHLIDEVVAPLILGTIEGLTWAFLTRHVCPNYLEYRGGNVSGPGIVLHTWASFYSACMFEFDGRDAANRYDALPFARCSRLLSMRWRLLPVGSMVFRLPRPFLEPWVRIGSRVPPVRPQPTTTHGACDVPAQDGHAEIAEAPR